MDTTLTPPAPLLRLNAIGIAVRATVAVAVLMGANLAVGALRHGLMQLLGIDAGPGASPWPLTIGIVMQALVLCLVLACVWAWMRWIERAPLRAAGWRIDRRSALWLLLGIAVSLGTVLGARAMLPVTGDVADVDAVLGEAAAAPTALLVVFYLGQSLLQQSIPEELLFRGWLLSRFRERPVLAIAVSTLTFTVIHLVSSGGQQTAWDRVAYLAIPFGFSLLAVGLMLHTASLWAAVGVHSGVHLGFYASAVALPQVDAAASWLVIGGVQATLGMALIVLGFRIGKRLHATAA